MCGVPRVGVGEVPPSLLEVERGGAEVRGRPEIGVCGQGTGSWAGCPHPELNFQEKRVLLKGGRKESSWGRGDGKAPPFSELLALFLCFFCCSVKPPGFGLVFVFLKKKK